MVFRNPSFLKYFRLATPEAELGKLNIGSRPSRRKPADAGESSLFLFVCLFCFFALDWNLGLVPSTILPPHHPLFEYIN